jgi:hypothetical protein
MTDAPAGASPPVVQYTIKPTDITALTRPFDVLFRDTRSGQTFDYITGHQARERLNEVFTPAGWECHVKRVWIEAEADEVMAHVQIRCRFILPDPNLPGELAVSWSEHENIGSQKVKRSRSTGTPMDLGFDFKGAITDGVKKCAADLGIALYLWKKPGGIIQDWEGVPDGAVAIASDGTPLPDQPTRPQLADQGPPQGRQPRQDGQGSPRALAAPRTKPAPATDEAVARYEVVRAEAKVAGFRADWMEDDPRTKGWTQPQIEGFTRSLESFLAKRAS